MVYYIVKPNKINKVAIRSIVVNNTSVLTVADG
jgi:hypothetical protein